ncbi:hypothetical protein ES703_63107 [subsurface metagenome]
MYSCENCGTKLSADCFVEFADGSKHARCHGCLAFCVIPAGAADPFEPEAKPPAAEPPEPGVEPPATEPPEPGPESEAPPAQE